MQVPHSSRSERVSLHVSVSSNSTTALDDSSLLVRFISLMVSVEWNTNQLSLTWLSSDLLFSSQSSSRITNIGAEYLVSYDQDTNTCRAREPKVDTTVLE